MLCWVISLIIWYFHNSLDKHCKLWFPGNEPLYVQEQASKKSQLSLRRSVLGWPSPTCCSDVWVPAPTLASPSLPMARPRIDPSKPHFPPANSVCLTLLLAWALGAWGVHVLLVWGSAEQICSLCSPSVPSPIDKSLRESICWENGTASASPALQEKGLQVHSWCLPLEL